MNALEWLVVAAMSAMIAAAVVINLLAADAILTAYGLG
jgi:hypothetical protein